MRLPHPLAARLPALDRWFLAALVAATVVAVAASAAAADDDYRQRVDVTFPTVADARFSDDYDVPRGTDSAHRATDLYTNAGAPVYAARGGVVTWVADHPSAGWAVHVRGDDGRTYAYYHLGPHDGTRSEAIADGVADGATVTRGQLIGYVGDSGNAVGGPPHLHFEIRDGAVTDPYGGDRINPVASLRAAIVRGDVVTSAGRRQGLAPVLAAGDQGPRVRAWQHELNAHRDTTIATDGVFGPETAEATRQLQRAEGVGVDGVVGPQTRAMSAAALAPGNELYGFLMTGERGARVAEWQQQLDGVLSRPVAVDGLFGSQTSLATRDFQRSRGLAVDGIVGPRTREAMAAAWR